MEIDFDPYGSDFIEDPYPELARIREATPIFVKPGNGDGKPVWYLTRHREVHRSLRDRRIGRLNHSSVDREEWGLPPLNPELRPFHELEHSSMVWKEGPDHTRIRGLVAGAFRPKRIAALASRITGHADRLLDIAIEKGSIDIVTEYAAPLSVRVIAEMIGAPTSDSLLMLGWSHRITQMYEHNATADDARRAVKASVEFSSYCADLIEQRRICPADDLITELCNAKSDEGIMSDQEIVSMMITLLNAGHEASVNTLANGMLGFMGAPDQWRRLTSGEVTPGAAVEEILRWDAALQVFDRWVLVDDFEVAGELIPKYQRVTLLLGSANRDPNRYHNPDDLDVGRDDKSHVSFGGGIHKCVGAPLARLELEIALARLVARCPELELVELPKRPPKKFVLRGFPSLKLAIV